MTATERISLCPRSQVFVDVFNLYVWGIGPIVITGMVFNVVNVWVLRHQGSKVNSVYLLQILAYADLAFLAISAVFFPIRHIYAYITQGEEVFRVSDLVIGIDIFYITIPLYFGLVCNRNWLIVLITMERLVSIAAPFWARAAITKRRLLAAAILNCGLGLAVSSASYVAYYYRPTRFPCMAGALELSTRPWYEDYDFYSYALFTVYAPLALMYAMNIALIASVVRAAEHRRRLTLSGGTDPQKEATAQRQATMMIIAMLVVFTVCETPACLDRLVAMTGMRFAPDDPFYNYARKIGLLLVVADSALNFFAYCVSNRKYRQTLWKLSGLHVDRRKRAKTIPRGTVNSTTEKW